LVWVCFSGGGGFDSGRSFLATRLNQLQSCGFDTDCSFVAARLNQLRVGVLAVRFNQLQGGV